MDLIVRSSRLWRSNLRVVVRKKGKLQLIEVLNGR
jgi:hypothetical protein